MSDDPVPTLTDAKGLGGLEALAGFDYQIWEALVRLPGWLQNPAFEGFIVEGLEDFEARFFSPYAPGHHVLDRFQAKKGMLSKADITAVFTNFMHYASAYPKTARVHTLITPALPATLRWIAGDQQRVQRARPFYQPFPTVMAASDRKIRKDLMLEFGTALGGFVAENADVHLRAHADIDAARLAFAYALDETFPELDVPQRRVKNAFDALVTLAGDQRGTLIARADVLGVLDATLGAQVLPDASLPVHIRSDRNADQVGTVEIDASKFAGGAGGFPKPEQWQYLARPLAAVAQWAHLSGRRRLRLSGSYRLSTAFAIGTAFRAASGFELEIPSRGTLWETDQHRVEDAVLLGWEAKPFAELVNGRLVIAVGVLRDPSQDVMHVLGLTHEQQLLHLQLERAISNAQEAQAAVHFIKSKVAQTVATYRPKALDLFFVGPAALAVALGHRWNALPPTQWYEFQGGAYVPTCHIERT